MELTKIESGDSCYLIISDGTKIATSKRQFCLFEAIE